MGFEARVLADSVAENGCRLTTLEVTFPRMVLAEFNTHRVFSRNSASSRAIPTWKQLKRILDEPFLPLYWGTNKPGMQAGAEIGYEDKALAEKLWLIDRDFAIATVVALSAGTEGLRPDPKNTSSVAMEEFDNLAIELNQLVAWAEPLLPSSLTLSEQLHKQTVNRLLETFMWHTVIVTATEWDNFWALRVSPLAQPEINRAAELMLEAYNTSTPVELSSEEWHLPLIQPDELEWAAANPEEARLVSAGRCARVSYLTHDGVRNRSEDIKMCRSLMTNGHMSPLEHVGRPQTAEEFAADPFSGNFRGWHQYRKDVPNEDNFALVLNNT